VAVIAAGVENEVEEGAGDIHSNTQKFDTDRTSTGKQNITSKHHTTLLHTFICRHPHAISWSDGSRQIDRYLQSL
jgi:hypothetical protein